MTDCSNITLRERLPELLAGSLSREESVVMESHIATCEACRAELGLLESARSVFESAAPQVDVDRIVAALQRPGAQPGSDGAISLADRRRKATRELPPSARRSVWRRRSVQGMALAAALSIAALGIWNSQSAIERGESGSWIASSGLSFGGDVSDLSDEALLALLDDLDNLEAAPPAEPDPGFAFFNDLAGD